MVCGQETTKTDASRPAPGLLKVTNDVKTWRFEQHEQGKGNLSVDGQSIKFETTKLSDQTWHVQAHIVDLNLKQEQKYTLKFKLKSDDFQQVNLMAVVDVPDWHQIGLYEELATTRKFKEHEFSFTATNVVPGKNRIGFTLGHGKGSVWIRDMTLTEAK